MRLSIRERQFVRGQWTQFKTYVNMLTLIFMHTHRNIMLQTHKNNAQINDSENKIFGVHALNTIMAKI